MITNLVDDSVYQLQRAPTCINWLILDSIDACFEEKYQIFIGYDFISCELGKDTKYMTSTERALVVDSLKESSNKLFLCLFVHLFIIRLWKYEF